jgi:hypothetical protein
MYLPFELEWAQLLDLEDWRVFYASQRQAATSPLSTNGFLRSSQALLKIARSLERRIPTTLSNMPKRLLRKAKMI